ncbi:MAG: hypothetical protein ACJAYU_004224 [Bradymonadia bacterium]|jgi:hypothetical protein
MKKNLLLLTILCAACSGDDTSGFTDVESDGSTDTSVADVEQDASELDAAPDTRDEDVDQDLEADVDIELGPEADAEHDAGPCVEGVSCAEDGVTLSTCADGEVTESLNCWDDRLLCRDAACVEPWRAGDPEWGACEGALGATPSTLAEKAVYYDDIAARLHVHPELNWLASVTLGEVELECGEGEEAPCFAPADPDTATYEDVRTFQSGANDGLWNGLYLTAQAYRYGATGDLAALEMVRSLMIGLEQRFTIAGVPGIFVRALRPDWDTLACPTDPLSYVPDIEKDDDRWVRIDDAGCAATYDPELEEFVSSDHCGMNEFAGWCFLDNVSQDEYAGHMLALAAVWRFVDDEQIRESVVEMMDQVGTHLVDNDLTFVDWDGRQTEHGILYATSFEDSPGFLAAQVLSWVKLAAEVTGRADLHSYYNDCLLQQGEGGKCLPYPLETGENYATSYLPQMVMYVGTDGCQSNFNRLSMAFANMWVLLEFENDRDLRAHYQGVLDTEIMNTSSLRSASLQNNSWFNFMYASVQDLDPDTTPVVQELVEDGICSLRQFPERKVQFESQLDGYERYCAARLGEDATEIAIDVVDRCAATFMWWRSPYSINSCSANTANVIGPADYLLAYWMARYYGFIDESL